MFFEPTDSLFASAPVGHSWHISTMASPGRRALSGQYRMPELKLTQQQEIGRQRDPLGNLQSWLEALYLRCSRGEIAPAIDQILEVVEEFLYEKKFARCDEVLRQANADHLSVEAMLALLMASARAREFLCSRTGFYERVERRLRQMQPSRVDELLANLR